MKTLTKITRIFAIGAILAVGLSTCISTSPAPLPSEEESTLENTSLDVKRPPLPPFSMDAFPRPPSSGNSFGDFEWAVSGDGFIEITGYTGPGGAIIIPSEINRLPVITIAREAFRQMRLTAVQIPNSVTSIGYGAFYGNRIASVNISNNTIDIEYAAFADNQLTSIIIPDSVITIGSYVFSDNQLTSVTIGANVTLETNSFNNGFENTYNNGGKRAGTYTRPNTSSTEWVKQ